MTKYIDADRLNAELEKLYDGEAPKHDQQCDYADGYFTGISRVFDVIDSLQQEQPEKSKKDCNDCPHCIDRKDQYGWHFKGCFGGPYKGKFIAEIDGCPLRQEQPEVDLKKFTEKIKTFQRRYKHPEIVSIKGAMSFMARMFYQYPDVARQWYDSLPKVTLD